MRTAGPTAGILSPLQVVIGSIVNIKAHLKQLFSCVSFTAAYLVLTAVNWHNTSPLYPPAAPVVEIKTSVN